jgi:hypothetical protein
MDDFEARDIFFGRRADKTIVSKRIVDKALGQNLRIASHVTDSQGGLRLAKIKDEMVLRETPSGRYEVKATFIEDDRSIVSLTLQRHSTKTGPLDRHHMTLRGTEIEAFLNFVAGVRTIPIEDEGKIHISDAALKNIVLNEAQARRLFSKHEALFTEIASNQALQRDIVAVGYRRKQLEKFEQLLTDHSFFAAEQRRLQTGPEGTWQTFFEANTWIFGYGLSFQFISGLDKRKLEQIVRGADVTGSGKRADALMKTRGIISSLCFVEVKRHDKPLLSESQTRPGVWAPSTYLTSAISQTQVTVQDAIEKIGRKLMPTDHFGNPTGELLFNIQPRSCLVVGHLSECEGEFGGVNESKFRSFELYRRQMHRPEILTFDELFERARFIVNHVPEPGEDDDEIPF